MEGASLDSTALGLTIFADTNLKNVSGLDRCDHRGPSTIDNETIVISQRIPNIFLRGCGLSDWQIEVSKLNNHELSNEEINDILFRIYDLRGERAIQINPLFISYNHKDNQFVEKIENKLSGMAIRYWRDVHHATTGRLEKVIDRAIRKNPIVLLVLSINSVESDWVQHEVRLARKLEIESGRDVLCPVALDDTWKTCKWPERIKEQIMEYNILDFSSWEENTSFQTIFNKLIDGLNIFYRSEM